MGAVAGAAALAGVGVAWRKYQPQELAEDVKQTLWQAEFAQIDGSRLSMAALRGKPLLLNFWATWCPPCVDELPLLSSFYQSNAVKGWQVLGLAVDQQEPVERFLARAPVTFPVALAGASGIEIGKSLGNLNGGLPFTVIFDSGGLIVHRKMGRVKPEDLLSWATLV